MISEGVKTITLTVPFGTDITTLVPTIVHTGISVSPASGTAQNFISPVAYTVTAENTSTQAYIVTVTEAAPVIAITNPIIVIGESTPSVTVTGINFKSGIGKSDLTVGLGTTGLILDSVSFVSTMEITVAFTGTAAVGEVTIQANISAFDPVSGSASNTLTIAIAVLIEVGDIYGGGTVAYILVNRDTGYDVNVKHGLITATGDQGTGIYLHATPTGITGATGTAVGTGDENTTKIIALYGAENNAARLCYEYTNAETGTGVYDDWFLPSKDELNYLYTNLKVAGVGGVTDGTYWSSSEISVNLAWYQRFTGGAQASGGKLNSC